MGEPGHALDSSGILSAEEKRQPWKSPIYREPVEEIEVLHLLALSSVNLSSIGALVYEYVELS